MNCVTAGNVLVQLFLQTQPKYQLNNRKLQYLLCIAQLSRLSYGKTLFEDDIRNLKYGFALDTIADTFIYNSNIVEGKTQNSILGNSFNDFVVPFKCKQIYAIKEVISEEDKLLLINVFIRFGGYNEQTLCDMLNEFTLLKQLPLFDAISKEYIIDFLSDVFDCNETKNNEILAFCQNEYINHKAKPGLPVDDTLVESVVSNATSLVDKAIDNHNVEASDCDEAILKKTIVYKSNILKQVPSLTTISVDKKCCVLIEVDSNRIVEDVFVINTSTNSRIPGLLKKINDNIYQYLFVGVASNLKISAKIVEVE